MYETLDKSLPGYRWLSARKRLRSSGTGRRLGSERATEQVPKSNEDTSPEQLHT